VTEIDEVYYTGVRKFCDFDIISRYISVTVQDSPIIAADDYQKSYLV